MMWSDVTDIDLSVASNFTTIELMTAGGKLRLEQQQ